MNGIDIVIRLFDGLASGLMRLLEALTGEDLRPGRLQEVREIAAADPRILVRRGRTPHRPRPSEDPCRY